MLKNLYIENIAVIEKADIDFSSGFQVLTGETGAGKSIIIDSLNAVLGQRTSKELIRAGCDTASVSALFSNIGASAQRALEDAGFGVDENGELLVRRVLSLNGNGSVKLNGKTASLGVLKTISEHLINIHGQHDNQGLLNADNHCQYLDATADCDKLLEEYYAEFRRLNSIRRELAALETDEDERLKSIELLKYQIEELTAADIHEGEYETLKKQLTAAESFQKTMQSFSSAEALLTGNDDADGAILLVKNAMAEASSVKDEAAEKVTQKLAEASALLEDALFDIRDYLNTEAFSPEDAEKLRERLDLLYKLMLKYGGSESEALSRLEKAERELSQINDCDKRIAELSAELDASTERLIALAERLTRSRTAAAEALSKKVTELLWQLDMQRAVFKVMITKGRYTKNGCDVVEFFIGTNVGEDIKPLRKIASGGELSRVMLAIKRALAEHDGPATLIFDEIDSGISGRAAARVGSMLKGVSQNHQVLCVTHLAQIAAFADRHLLIQKNTEHGRTYTLVTPLSYEERIPEIARIMSGGEMTESLYNSAKELLDRSMNNGNL